MIIGGALKADNADVYNTFIQLGGGKDRVRIAIIPAASGAPVKSGTSYIEDFEKYGVPAANIKLFPVAVKDDPSTKEVDESTWRGNGSDKELAKEMRDYTAVFFVGGDQERYLQTLVTTEGKDTPLLAAIRKVFARGGVLGGTSAGAAIMSDPMICGGAPIDAVLTQAVYKKDACPKDGGVKLTKGLGFFTHGLTGQHFLKRGRMGRMIPALFYLKKAMPAAYTGLAFGVDEDTALIYKSKGQTIEVAGRSGILVTDTRKAEGKRHYFGLRAGNIILHYLEAGDVYHLETGAFSIDKNRKKIQKGKEYYKTSPLETDILGKDAVKRILTVGLADCLQSYAEGIAFFLPGEDAKMGVHTGRGVKMTFTKTGDTSGYWGKVSGRDTYSVLHVRLDFTPIKIKITEGGME